MTSNNDQNTANNNQNNDKRKPLTPTIGEAVKEALETGKEVVMAGPTEAGDTTGVKDDDALHSSEMNQGNREPNKGFALTPDNDDGSKITINVKDPSQDSPLVEDKIIVNPEDAKENPEEATIATVTTVPAAEGVDVEVQTELDVPLEDKDKDVESELKVKVHSPTVSREVPISPQQQQQQTMQSASLGENELMSSRFNNQDIHELQHENLDKGKGNAQMPTGETESSSPHSQSIDEVQKQSFQVAKDIANNYRDFQRQLTNSFQSMFVPYLGNTNLVWDSQAYLGRVLGAYSRMAMIYTENAMALNRLARDIAFANIEAFTNLIHNSKGKPE
jgi:hypothetical protein